LIGTVDGSLYGLDSKSGRQKWVLNTPKLFSSSIPQKSGDSTEIPVFIPSIDGSNSIYVLTENDEVKVPKLSPFLHL
jgi:hypothetical protein